MFNISTILDERIDETAIADRATLKARVVVMGTASSFLAANFGARLGCLWFCAAAVCEFGMHLAARHMNEGMGGSIAKRAAYVAVMAATTAVWTSLLAFYWFSGNFALQIVGIIGAAGQLIHAQAFTFRSPILLTINGGIPAAMLVILLLCYGGFAGLDLLTLCVGLIATLGYVINGSRQNIASTQALKESRAELRAFAYNDMLTGLSNRRRFAERLETLCATAERHDHTFSLLLLDLDKFKSINDLFGHDAGDAVLVEAAARLRGVLRLNDEAFRLGGDEFAVIVSPGNVSAVSIMVRDIIAGFRGPIVFKDRPLHTKPSIGIATFAQDGRTPDCLYKAADLHLYEAKRRGGNGWVGVDGVLPVRSSITPIDSTSAPKSNSLMNRQ